HRQRGRQVGPDHQGRRHRDVGPAATTLPLGPRADFLLSKGKPTSSGRRAMIIREFDITPCTMRKEDPTWRFALAASPVTEGQVLRIATDDGHEGFGYASATAHMGSTKETLKAELELFRSIVVGKDPRNIEAILVALDSALRGAPQAKAAIDCALHEV